MLLIDQIAVQHAHEYSIEPEVICSAPGKVDLLGEHGESGQGCVLSFALDKRLCVAMSKREDNSLFFYSTNLRERKRTTVNSLRLRREDRWANCFKGTIHELTRMGFNIRGISVTVSSEIPMGIGLGSSTAMAVAAAYALKELFVLDLSHGQLLDVARSAESKFIGTQQSLYPSIVVSEAKKDHLCLIDASTHGVEHLSFPTESIAIIITDSRVPQIVNEEEKAEIDDAYRECVVALGLPQSGERIRNLDRHDLAGTIKGLSERSRRVILHLITENERIRGLRSALEGGMHETLGRILFSSHESLRDYLEISCPELDWLAKRCVEIEGVYGSRMIGVGYGGSTVAFLAEGKQDKYAACLEDYDRIFGFKANFYAVRVSEGVIVHR